MRAWLLKLVVGGVTAVASIGLLGVPLGHADEMDILLDKLVQKGVFTRDEAKEIRAEVKAEAMEKKQPAGESKVPDWVAKTRLGGDLRLRYENTDREDTDVRERGRYRLRLGIESMLADSLKVGVGIATGSGDPRSTNQTFTDSFSKPSVRFDYVFAEYRPFDWVTITGGKFHNPLWRPSDLLWDSDITPEGAAISFSHKIDPVKLFLNTGFFLIDENGSGGDPLMFAVQPGIDWTIVDPVNLKVAVSYYNFNSLQGRELDFSAGTNTLSPRGLVFDYDSYGASAALTFKEPFGSFIPAVSLFGEYIHNPDPEDDNSGYIAGIRIGKLKIEKLHDWLLEYSYRRLERDAWPDIFPDSDFHGGDTDVKGHEVILSYGLHKNVYVSLDYYNTRRILADREREDLFQFDLNFKF